MSSDLNDFFAKKASKTKKKTKGLNVGTLGQKLEKNNQLEEERERKESQDIGNDAANDNQGGDADSEWIDPSAHELTTNLEELGIKDMASSAYAEDEESEHEKVEAEPVKTWGTASKKVEDTSKSDETPAIAPASSKYRPPSSRNGGSSRLGGPGMKVDINNEDLFPSLAAAAIKIKEEKTKTEEMKTAKSEGWQHVHGGAKPVSNSTPSPLPQSNHFSSRTSANPLPPPANSIFAKTSSNAYRPPAARGESNIVASNPRPSPTVQEQTLEEKKPD
uniref:Uncharacterized protein n=1 Tax=Panagrolaimus sp. ES5 TaxID=591445 RepID=A0AC34FDK5_9BILA